MAASIPTAIAIPALRIHSRLQRLGQNPDGTIQVPTPGPLYNTPGWYRYSPTPGTLGPAIILGHVDSANDGPSIFYRLGELKPGDTISITRADTTTAVFAVTAVRRYPKSSFPTHLVYGNTNQPALRLLTCGGTFDHATGHYRDNIVVYATLTGL